MLNLISAKKDLTAQELSILSIEFQRCKKSPTTMWLLWLFFGIIGGHRYYLGDWGNAIPHTYVFAMAFLGGIIFSAGAETAVEALFYAPILFFLLLSIPALWSLIDAIFIGRRLKKKNEDIEMNIIQQIKRMRS